MDEYEIEFEREKCIGAGTCVSAARDNWRLDTDGKARVRRTTITASELQRNLDAAKSCPVNVIHIRNKQTGEKLI